SCEMKATNICLAGLAFAVAVSHPAPARAETLFIPWIGANTSVSSGSSGVDLGASIEQTVSGVIGLDFDFGYSPDFFGRNLNSLVVTAMGNVVLGMPFDGARGAGIRPYVTGGIGLIRARIDVPLERYSFASNDLGVDFGGGVTGFMGAHLGVRADIRYIRSLEDDGVIDPLNPGDLSRLHYWRTSFAVVLR